MTASNNVHPRSAVGILVKDPTMAYVVGPVLETHVKLAKFRKNPINPAKVFFQK
jgi:hypothetical protein